MLHDTYHNGVSLGSMMEWFLGLIDLSHLSFRGDEAWGKLKFFPELLVMPLSASYSSTSCRRSVMLYFECAKAWTHQTFWELFNAHKFLTSNENKQTDHLNYFHYHTSFCSRVKLFWSRCFSCLYKLQTKKKLVKRTTKRKRSAQKQQNQIWKHVAREICGLP